MSDLRRKKKAKKPRLSNTRRPVGMSLEDWQVALRRQFGREQKFKMRNTGRHPVFSDFDITNPESRNTYRVRIRGPRTGDNACSCPDFATNALGTCKHIEFTLARLERTPENRRALKAGHLPAASEIWLQYGSAREVRFRPGLECPVELARLAADAFGADSALLPEAIATFTEFLEEAQKLEPALECAPDVLAYLAELRDAEARRETVAKAFPRGIRSAAFKDVVKATLYDYQREGALFAARAGRCLIGDEMGLGKTIQAIAAAEIMARLHGVERVLIVCPTSLKHQWEREIAKFTDRTVSVINGMWPDRQPLLRAPGAFFKVTNYDTIHADLDSISAWSPDLVVLDEAQRIKNWKTRTARSVKKIASPYAIVLTGTPLENRLEELVSIVQFIDLYRLGPTYRLLHDHQVTDEAGKVTGYRDLDKLGQSLAPILIRRQKSQVLTELPERLDTNVFVPMTGQQMEIHSEYKETVARIVLKWRRFGFLTEADKQRLMTALQGMRMVCDSTYLIDADTEFGTKPDEAVELLGEMLEKPGAKVVVFSQWIRMHELMKRRLDERGIGHVFFNGSVPSAERRLLIDSFREDPDCRVFLATDAGSVGLNLQHACAVVNLDLPWNPAVLEQRIGRVHRLGQTQPVQVVNFVARGGIEEGMLELLRFKTSLFKGVLDGGEKDISLGGSRLKRFMETVEKATDGIPTPPVEEKPAPEPEPVVVPAAQPDPWAGLLQAGMALLQQFSAPAAAPTATAALSSVVRKDESTGESYLRLPVPSPDLVKQALGLLQQFLGGTK
ncbi:MAG: DEAD/DEAH box helicase [Gemmataceae bacterium]|nr:DEAD/DEAH box helicase [Gemmataceae bacterium]